ncbi:hypothetical protein QEZ40_007571 [Streptomyces katrae]|uniref:Uncharacterized protein n=1 Tax=Streptomyces katrae TaxID=68223 RepID=A0ABT7H7Z7_9ACTN|nr:hypothetical protein [Streptomyces katrae]MDK9501199.1 hypothetical protein [Streptomyces katrae]
MAAPPPRRFPPPGTIAPSPRRGVPNGTLGGGDALDAAKAAHRDRCSEAQMFAPDAVLVTASAYALWELPQTMRTAVRHDLGVTEDD